MIKTIKIKFVDFWPGFVPQNSFIFRILSQRYILEMSETPDLLFFPILVRKI